MALISPPRCVPALQARFRRGATAGVAPCGARRLAACRAGTVAMELAMLAPLTFVSVFIGLGYARLFLLDTTMRNTLIVAARYGATGNDFASGQRLANIGAMMTGSLGFTPTLTITPYDSWASLAAGTPSTSSYGPPGAPGAVVVYTATYTDPLINTMLGMLPLLHGAGGSSTRADVGLAETTIVQNEPAFSIQ